MRRGFTLIEVMVAGTLLGAVMLTVTPLLGWVARERHAAEQREVAVQEVANILERVTARNWEEITSAAVSGVKLAPESASFLDDAELRIEITENEQQPLSKQVSVSLQWKDRFQNSVAPVRVTTWVYQRSRN